MEITSCSSLPLNYALSATAASFDCASSRIQSVAYNVFSFKNIFSSYSYFCFQAVVLGTASLALYLFSDRIMTLFQREFNYSQRSVNSLFQYYSENPSCTLDEDSIPEEIARHVASAEQRQELIREVRVHVCWQELHVYILSHQDHLSDEQIHAYFQRHDLNTSRLPQILNKIHTASYDLTGYTQAVDALSDERKIVFLKSASLAQKKELTDRQKAFYLNQVAIPSGQLNPRHLTEFSSETFTIPPAPEEVRVEDLLDMFDNLNFERPEEDSYINPLTLYDDNGICVSRDSLQRGIRRVVAAVQDGDSWYGDDWHNRYSTLMKHIVVELQKPNVDAAEKSGTLKRLAIGGRHCGDRIIGEALNAYLSLTSSSGNEEFMSLSITSKINTLLHRFRLQIIEHMVAMQGSAESAVLRREYLALLNDDLALGVGDMVDYHDPCSDLFLGLSSLERFFQPVTAWNLRRNFYSLYNLDTALDFIKNEIDARPDMVSDWFRDFPPQDRGSAEYPFSAFDDNFHIKKEFLLELLEGNNTDMNLVVY